MPKRASTDDAIDPVRARLAAAASAPVTTAERRPAVQTMPAEPLEARPEARREAVGEGGAPSPLPRSRAIPEPARAIRGTSLTINRKIMVTPEEADRIEAACDVISSAFGSKVTYSQVSRAMWSILSGADEAIKAGARRAPRMSVPSKGDHLGMAEYEQALADFLATALRR